MAPKTQGKLTERERERVRKWLAEGETPGQVQKSLERETGKALSLSSIRYYREKPVKKAEGKKPHAAPSDGSEEDAGGGRRTAGAIPEPERGDIICFNRNGGSRGHVGIYLGEGYFAENTSSTKRGPGTVRSRLSDMPMRISGCYRVLAEAGPGGYEDGEIVVKIADRPFRGLLKSGKAYLADEVPVRLLEEVGAEVTDHLMEQRVVYVYRKTPGHR